MGDTDPSPDPAPESGPPADAEQGPPPDQEPAPEEQQENVNADGGAEMKVQVKKTGLQSFSTFMYNKQTGEVLGRTGRRWLKIFIFYVIFYIAVFAFFFLLIFLMLQILPFERPRLTNKSSLLMGNPGLSFRPQNDNNDSSLIWYRKSNAKDVKFYTDQLKELVNKDNDFSMMGKTMGRSKAKMIDCLDVKNFPKDDEVCTVYMSKNMTTKDVWGGCTEDNMFGYKTGTPCVLIRLNQIIDWTPADESDTAFKNAKIPKHITPTDIKGHVWIECRGETQLDNELMGDLNVFPNHRPKPGAMSLPPNYFPYKKGKGYLPPFVMLQFSGPTCGVLIKVRCFAYNKNVTIDKRDGLGTVMIELLVDR